MKEVEFREDVGAAGGALDVRVAVGRVVITAHDTRQVTVSARVENVDVAVWQEKGKVHVRADVNEEGRKPGQRVRAELQIKVPVTCHVWARTVTGLLDISDVAGPVVTQVDTGATKLANLGSSVHAATTTGKIAYAGKLAATTHSFRATTGKLLLQLDPQTDAHLTARATTGSIATDLPLQNLVKERSLVGARLRGTLGAGAAAVQARVVTGSVRLQARREEA